MKLKKLPFININKLHTNIAELTVEEGVEVSTEMVDEIHSYLSALFASSFSLLINKSNSYSTELDALMKFGTLPAINKIAVFAPNKMAKISADFAAHIPSSKTLNIQVFTKRNDALSWLGAAKK